MKIRRRSFVKRILLILCAVSALAVFGAPAEGKKPSALVVFYSWSDAGNTRVLARMIAEKTGADLEELVMEKPYPRVYRQVLAQGRKDLEKDLPVPLKKLKKIPADYTTVFVGTPIWFATYAPPVRTFLRENDLSGRKVYFFCTHGRGGPGRFFADARKLCPRALPGKDFSCYGTHIKKVGPQVDSWIKENVK